MYRISLIICLLISELECDKTDYMGTVLNIGEDKVVSQIEFETEQDDWTINNMKIVDTANSLENVDNIPGEGHVAVPQLSMTGNDWGEVFAKFSIPAITRVAVEFSIYVSGFDPQADNPFLSTNPDLIVSLTNVNTSSQQKLTNLARLNPQNNLWNRYKADVQTGEELGLYKISLEALRGSGMIALDKISVEIVPVVAETMSLRENGTVVDKNKGKDTDVPVLEETTTLKGNSTVADGMKGKDTPEIDPEGTPINDTVIETANNSTDKLTNTTDTASKSTDKITNTTDTVDNPVVSIKNNTQETINSTEIVNPSEAEQNQTEDTPVLTNITSQHENQEVVDNFTSGNISSNATSVAEDISMYGYTGEVVLICLTIMFIILFLGMVYKYYMLKSHFGDYQLDQGGSRHDNQGFDGQMNYRVED